MVRMSLKSKVLGSINLEQSIRPRARTLGGDAPGAWRWRVVAIGSVLSLSPDAAQNRPHAPFVGTPLDVVDRMLTLANTRPGDVVYDIGCGDGRIVIMAAEKFGAR